MTSTGEFVKTRSGSDTCRSGMPVINHNMTCKSSFFAGNACRYKVAVYLIKQLQAPRDAEDAYSDEQRAVNNALLEPSPIESPAIEYQFSQLSAIIQLDLLFKLFSSYATREPKLSDDFVVLAARAMMQLKDGKDDWEDGSDSRFPANRMPMGLVKYIASSLLWTNYNLLVIQRMLYHS